METRARYALIGFFTLAVIAVAFFFVYWLKRLDETGVRQTMYLEFPGTVSGLEPGGSVYFNGLKVGEVSKLQFDPKDPNTIIVEAAVRSDTPIKTDTKAKVGASLLTGVAYVEMSGGSPTAKSVFEVTPPLVVGQGVGDIMTALNNVAAKVDTIVTKLDKVVTENEAGIKETIENVRSLSGDLAKNSGGIADFLKSVSEASKTIAGLSDKLTNVVDKVDKVVDAVKPDEVKSTIANIKDLSARLIESSKKLDVLFGKANDMLSTEGGKNFFQIAADSAKSIKELADNLNSRVDEIATGLVKFSNQGLGNIDALVGQLRGTAGRLDRVLANIERNPSSLVFGGNSGVREYNRR